MDSNNKKSIFYRFIICSVFVAIWVILIANFSSDLPSDLSNGFSTLQVPQKQTYHPRSNYSPRKSRQTKKIIEKREESIVVQEKKQKPIEKKIEEKEKEEKKAVNKEEGKIVEEKKETEPSDIKLRKSIKIDFDNKPLAINTLNSEFQKSWIPAYINKKEELNYKSEQVTENLENTANKIAFVGLITNSNGSKVVIIKNFEDNQVKYLQTGDIYKGLTLTSISENSIELENKNLNKTFIKNLILLQD